MIWENLSFEYIFDWNRFSSCVTHLEFNMNSVFFYNRAIKLVARCANYFNFIYLKHANWYQSGVMSLSCNSVISFSVFAWIDGWILFLKKSSQCPLKLECSMSFSFVQRWPSPIKNVWTDKKGKISNYLWSMQAKTYSYHIITSSFADQFKGVFPRLFPLFHL